MAIRPLWPLDRERESQASLFPQRVFQAREDPGCVWVYGVGTRHPEGDYYPRGLNHPESIQKAMPLQYARSGVRTGEIIEVLAGHDPLMDKGL